VRDFLSRLFVIPLVFLWWAGPLLRALLKSWRQRPVWAAGSALIVVGVLCLCLSGAVVGGWWQGTLDAFGVGFVVGGIVDVVAISKLNQVLAERHRRYEQELASLASRVDRADRAAPAMEKRRRPNNEQAQLLLYGPRNLSGNAAKARLLLSESGDEIDPRLRVELEELIERAAAAGGEEQRRVNGDAPRVDGTVQPTDSGTP
jgi:hypothetical protein